MKPEDFENIRYSEGHVNPIELEEKVMFSWLPKNHGCLLDVGCGVGNIAVELQKYGFEVFGIDFSSVAINQAHESGVNAKVCDVDREGIPFDNDYFDVIWAGDVIEHVYDPIFLLKEVFRTLKPKGVLLLTTPNVMTIKQRLIIAITGRSPQTQTYRRWKSFKHHTLFSRELLEFMVNGAGLKLNRLWARTKLPGFRNEILLKNRFLVSLLGTMFIAEVTK